MRIDDTLVALAVQMESTLRSPEAVHLATAISLGQDVSGMVVYDRRLAAAARSAGMTTWAPA